MFQAMRRRGVMPQLITYSALISTSEKGKHPTRALDVFQAMQRHSHVPDATSLESLIPSCSASCQWESAWVLLA